MADAESTGRSEGLGRTIGFLGATGVGVGAIVGGGILALAGAAYAATGPSAILAFALNGLIAFLTALSFAEISAAVPLSGGTYTYNRLSKSVKRTCGGKRRCPEKCRLGFWYDSKTAR